jgi:branched-chain amino acid transport system permease protein
VNLSLPPPDILLGGLVRGSIYGLVALGYTMVYGILGMINFAHGEIFMIGMFACIYALGFFSTYLGTGVATSLALSAFVAMIFSAGFGYANERIAYRKLRKAHILAPLTSAIGLSIILQNFVWLTVSKNNINFPRLYSEPLNQVAFTIAGAHCNYLQLLVLGTAVALMALLYFFILHTRLGIALRATAQDQLMAGLVGISVNKTIGLTFIVGSALAAIAGVMVSMYLGVAGYNFGYIWGLKAFTAAVLGGIGNIPGAVLGGFIIGMTEDVTCFYVDAQWRNCVTFIILMVVLILRPRGILGERVADKV